MDSLGQAVELLKAGAVQVVVVQGDCLKILPQLEKSLISLTVTDPPYESLERHRAKGTTTRLKESDASSNKWFQTFPNTSYWKLFEELHRVQGKGTHCYVFCDSETEHVILSGRNPMDAKLDTALLAETVEVSTDKGGCATAFVRTPCGPWTVWPSLVWVKTKKAYVKTDYEGWDPLAVAHEQVSKGMGYHWRRSHEMILFLEKGKRKLNDLSMNSVLFGPKASRTDYPTEKPQAVLDQLILNSSSEGDIVLDCFAGSGSSGTAALALGRKAILIDLDISEMKKRLGPGTIFIE